MLHAMSHCSNSRQLHTLHALISEEALPQATTLKGGIGNGEGHTLSKTDIQIPFSLPVPLQLYDNNNRKTREEILHLSILPPAQILKRVIPSAS